MKTRWGGYLRWGGVGALILAAFVFGYLVSGSSESGHAEHDAMAGSGEPEVWTCSMHPQIKLPEPGQCPICFMDLIPLESGDDDDAAPREISVSPYAEQLMELQTAPVERRAVAAEVRMVGKVDYDETRVSYITAWVPGRLDRLFVDYTGIRVRKGDHMVELYSPDLLSAQEELLQAVKTAEAVGDSGVSAVEDTAQATIEAARERLRLWGLTTEQIRDIETRDAPADTVTIYAPAGGIVVARIAREGMYVETGTRIYTIADLSRVWVKMDAYESDLAWLRYGQPVEFTTESHPGTVFTGTISFIHPILDEDTRTVKVRVNVDNADRRLKPGMFVRAVVRADMAEDGRIRGADLEGRWMCPMHPDVVADHAGDCDICGMPLERADELGYGAPEDGETGLPLVIPASAALLTGERAVVYVEKPGTDKPIYEGRTVRLGPRAGEFYLVREGLSEGERVVTRGNFKLDAELQIRARPSMMMPEDGATAGAHAGHAEHAAQTSEPRAQTHCPVMGGAIDKEVYVDYRGMRIYFCCPGCEKTFLEDPDTYLKQMRDQGVEPERIEGGHEH